MLVFPAQPVFAAPRADVTEDQVTFDFPNTATFSATLEASSSITSVTLEYGNEQQTCGDVIAIAFPEFTSAKTTQVAWTWDMRQSGSLPPGASIWWRWRYTDESGAQFSSDLNTATWLDDVHDWQTITSGDLRLHWYGNDQSFAQTMLDAGVEGLRRNKEQAGLTTDSPIDLYVYPNYDDMREAILYEPSWTGGMAFPDYNIFIMGVSGSDSTWDKNTVIHELTHILVGHFTFSCIGTVPTWLNEGLAMFSEGALDDNMQSLLDQAISNNTVLTIRSLNGGFSELADKANLSYSESHSIVTFLINEYGQEKITELLGALRDAKPIDDALVEVYGFDTDGLEDLWRESVGAAPRTASAQATSQPTPTFVPTYVPVSGAPLAMTPTPYAIPTSSFTESGCPQGTANRIDHRLDLFLRHDIAGLRRIGPGINCPLAKS
ncbi:MAG: hypothetical protein IPL71_02635 [Anaerolineales bacterium]|uniref:peptidase MA family metallohydrolase n=1 Tax=Candidatus Villigracilis proximus TaxID=3140683 RepID=UPI0031347822|nr:hypothetical protein [Anaerolineales bacterium]